MTEFLASVGSRVADGLTWFGNNHTLRWILLDIDGPPPFPVDFALCLFLSRSPRGKRLLHLVCCEVQVC